MSAVACFGEVLWDVFQRSPENRSDYTFELGGAPANVASTLGKLGCASYIVGSVGRDRFGTDLREKLESDGVDTRFLVALPQRTGLAFVFRDEAGEPSFLFYRKETADMMYRASMLPKRFPPVALALVGTSTLMDEALRAATLAFIQRTRKAGAELVVDLNVRAHLWPTRASMLRETRAILMDAALIKASSADLQALGTDLPWLRRAAPDAVVLLTRGGGRAEVHGPFGRVFVPTEARKVVDATGAGDAFLSGVLASLAGPSTTATKAEPPVNARDRGFWRQAATIGHAIAAQAITSAGATSGIKRLAQPLRLLKELRP